MATIKAYTDIKQSRKLAEILPLESADMCYPLPYEEGDKPLLEKGGFGSTPCWSLAALLEFLSKWAERVDEAGIAELSYNKELKWGVSMINCGKIKDCYADNTVDACYEMILKLHELKML